MEPERYLDASLFSNQKQIEIFICCFCTGVSIDPVECRQCEALFCSNCYKGYEDRNTMKCPRAQCDLKQKPIKNIDGGLKRIYNSLEIRCDFPSCGKKLQLSMYFQHRQRCQAQKCKNYNNCDQILKQNQEFCSPKCQFFYDLSQQDSIDKMYKMMSDQFIKYVDSPVKKPNKYNSYKQIRFKWSRQNCSKQIQIKNSDMSLKLKENSFIFRTVLGDIPLEQGIYYWEIQVNQNNQMPIKVGVSTTKDINMDSAFCDYETGFGYYGLGQLRNGSNSKGMIVSQKIINDGIVGVCLNMNQGKLMFSLNSRLIDEGFSDESLKQGPIYPAVSLIHDTECSLILKQYLPYYFR